MIRFSVIATIAVCGVSSVHAQSAEEILSATGIQGGLVVHVDCGDGKLTAALHAGDSYLVHGLDTDAEQAAAAHEHIRSLDQVSFDRPDPGTQRLHLAAFIGSGSGSME
jgi:2-polyprenyl-3-methyl-5-hydroxy-6-metoxy-1,4-benzoquinol methylase